MASDPISYFLNSTFPVRKVVVVFDKPEKKYGIHRIDLATAFSTEGYKWRDVMVSIRDKNERRWDLRIEWTEMDGVVSFPIMDESLYPLRVVLLG